MSDPSTGNGVPLSDAQLDRVAEGIALGEYSLLLGAGASVGATAAGHPLLTGQALAEELIEKFALPGDPKTTPLTLAYEAATDARTVDGLLLADFLRGRFLGCVPAPWHGSLPSMSWRRIWTLNIDDTIEAAYSADANRRQTAYRVSWDERHRDSDPTDVQVVHLHGVAERPDSAVFSILEYLHTARVDKVWHKIFADHYVDHPFLILGASLTQELDLAQVIRQGSVSAATRGRPSVLIAETIEPLNQALLARHGVIPVEMTAAEFFARVVPRVRVKEVALKEVVGDTGARLSVEAKTFLAQFERLLPDVVPPLEPHDFYQGYDPSWFDILLDKDAVLDAAKEVSASLLALGDDWTGQRIEVIHGPWGTGKSTALLRVGRLAIREGLQVWRFRADEALDAASVLWWLRKQPRTVLLFDALSDVGPELELLVRLCSAARVPLRVVGVTRDRKMRRLRASLPRNVVASDGARYMQSLSNSDVEELLSTLRSHARLGKITRWSAAAQRLYFVKDHNRRLFTAMADLEEGPGFYQRLTAEFRDPAMSNRQRELVSLVAFAYQFGNHLPMSTLSRATGLPAAKLKAELESEAIAEWVQVEPRGAKLSHRRVAAIIVEDLLDAPTRYRLSLGLVRSLAPHVDRTAITRRTLAFRITRSLMTVDAVRRWVGEAAVRWYAELATECGWNARYWEQRALCHLRSGDFSTARSYSEKALGIHRDAFTLTTFGNVVLKQLLRGVIDAGHFSSPQFLEAADALALAQEMGYQDDDSPSMVMLIEGVRILRELQRRGIDGADVRSTLESWMSQAVRNPLYQVPNYRQLVDRARREFARIPR